MRRCVAPAAPWAARTAIAASRMRSLRRGSVRRGRWSRRSGRESCVEELVTGSPAALGVEPRVEVGVELGLGVGLEVGRLRGAELLDDARRVADGHDAGGQ